MATRQRPGQTAAGTYASRTLTIHETPTPEAGGGGDNQGDQGDDQVGRDHAILRLRGGNLDQRRVVWTDETVDNEGMGRKKSKICCIYHKPRAFDESSSSGSSSSSNSSDSESESDTNSSPFTPPRDEALEASRSRSFDRRSRNTRGAGSDFNSDSRSEDGSDEADSDDTDDGPRLSAHLRKKLEDKKRSIAASSRSGKGKDREVDEIEVDCEEADEDHECDATHSHSDHPHRHGSSKPKPRSHNSASVRSKEQERKKQKRRKKKGEDAHRQSSRGGGSGSRTMTITKEDICDEGEDICDDGEVFKHSDDIKDKGKRNKYEKGVQ